MGHAQWLEGCCPGETSRRKIRRATRLNQPNVFQDQEYKYGSVGNPDPAIRKRATDHMLDCVAIADALECRDISPWFADGSNYPGTQNIRHRIGWFEEALKAAHAGLNPETTSAGRVQAVRTRVLSHRHRRLGHGVPAGAQCRPPSLRAGGHRPSLSGPEHRADRGLAAASRT